MGLTAGASSAGAASSSAAGASLSATSLLSPVGVGVGGVVVAAALVCLLAYYDIASAAERDYDAVRKVVPAAIGPLLATFAAIVAFESLTVLGYLG